MLAEDQEKEDEVTEVESILMIRSTKSKWKRKRDKNILSDLKIDELTEKVERTEKRRRFLTLETAMLEHYYEEKILTGCNGDSEESGSSSQLKSQPPSPHHTTAMHAIGRKQNPLKIPDKIMIAQNYLRRCKDKYKLEKKLFNKFVESNTCMLVCLEISLKEIPKTFQELKDNFEHYVKAKGEVPFLHIWEKYVTAKKIKRDSLYFLLELGNTRLMRSVRKLTEIKKYRAEVDPVEFYSKYIEKGSLTDECKSIADQKSRLRRVLIPIERLAYEKKQELDATVKKRDELLRHINRENHSLTHMVGKLTIQEDFKFYEEQKFKELKDLMYDYKVPSLFEYIDLVKGNQEYTDLVHKWEKKVRLSEIVYLGQQTKYKRVTKSFKQAA